MLIKEEKILKMLKTDQNTSLAAAVAPRTGKFIKNDLNVFERGENLPHQERTNKAKFSQLSEMRLESLEFM